MTSDNDLSNTVTAKSDQLNSDDLIEPILITITRVDKVESKDQPVWIHSEGRQPFKPCLTMRRMLIAAWGKFKDEWVGKSLVVYCDPEVMWAGKPSGGVRISHVSDIEKPVSRSLQVTRGRKAMYTLLPLTVEPPAMYPAEQFDEKLPAMLDAISSGKMTPEQVIAHCEKTGKLNPQQIDQINQPAPAADAEAEF